MERISRFLDNHSYVPKAGVGSVIVDAPRLMTLEAAAQKVEDMTKYITPCGCGRSHNIQSEQLRVPAKMRHGQQDEGSGKEQVEGSDCDKSSPDIIKFS